MKHDCYNCGHDYRYDETGLCDKCHTPDRQYWVPQENMRDFAIAELEKLEKKIIRNSRPYREKLVIDVYTCQILIRKEIAELKGENNE